MTDKRRTDSPIENPTDEEYEVWLAKQKPKVRHELEKAPKPMPAIRVRSPDRARADLEAVSRYLLAAAETSRLEIERDRLNWAGRCIQSFLSKELGRPETLEQAFGLTGKQGRPAKTSEWGERAAMLDAGLISREVAMVKWKINDNRSFDRGLARGRKENAKAAFALMIAKASSRLAAEMRAESRAGRKAQQAEVEAWMREKGVRYSR